MNTTLTDQILSPFFLSSLFALAGRSPMAVQYFRSIRDSEMHHNNHDGDDNNDADDGSDTASDTSDDVVEVPPDEIPDYFEERGGRLFHSHGGCPYPLPVDAEEQRVRASPVISPLRFFWRSRY